MPCGRRIKRRSKYMRYRAVDVGSPGGHYIRIGVRRKKGKRGGRTERIGRLRRYKRKHRSSGLIASIYKGM
jgi:hypothetical protein